MSIPLHTIFNGARIDDRAVNELMGLAHGMIADGIINQQEAEYLQKWLAANLAVRDNPVVSILMQRVSDMLADNVLDAEEAKDLFECLTKFSGGDFELGELLKSTSLPLDDPQPQLNFDRTNFCFTGTFAYGTRKKCEEAVAALGASSGSLTRDTHYLIIGIYATDSWAHSSYGRKIEKAVSMKRDGHQIAIIGEGHWLSNLT
jgi:NAD-dependent DNA ligase